MKNDNGMLYLLLGGAALVFWYMSQQPEDAINGQPQNANANGAPLQPSSGANNLQSKGPSPAPPASSYPITPVVPSPLGSPNTGSAGDVPPGKIPPQGNYAYDPVVPLAARLVAQAGSGSQNVDEWNYHFQQIQGGAEQPDPLTFLPEGFDRTQNISATDYVRYRGLGRATASNNRYTPQASRIIRNSSF